MEFTRAFEPDEDYDTNYASDGVSRYGAYLAQCADLFRVDAELTTDAGRFAAAAWRVAQPPTMLPGYIRHHGRVQDTVMKWDDDGRLAVRVELAASAAPEIVGLRYPWRRWTCDDFGRWWEPDDFADPIAVTLLRVAVPLTGMRLPEPRYQGRWPDASTAKRAVQAICARLNAELASVVAFDPLARTSP